jgi:hypothetical protein
MIGKRRATVHGLVVAVSARVALRSMRPLVRVVLEDVALDAVWRDGRLVAATSARCGFRRISYSDSGRFRTAIPEVFVQA